jgi:hypothetical protein
MTDDILAARLAALANPIDDSDWLDVMRHAQHGRIGRRHLLAAAIIAVLAVAIATPAFGLHRAIIDWFQAEPAPERVQLQFARLPIGAPPGMDPGVIPNAARKVTEMRHDGEMHVLWVAPTRQDGFCYQWTELFGGCRKDRLPPPALPQLSPDLNSFLLGLTWSPDAQGVMQNFGGALLAMDTERLVAEFADGAEIEIPITWVSPPINAGFYLYWVPAEHRRPGHHMTALVAEDRDGKTLARQTFRLTPPADVERAVELPDGQIAHLPAKAIVEQARKLIDFRAENGRRVTLWLIPTKDGGRCYAHSRGSGCPPRPLDVSMAAALHSGGRPVLFGAQVRDEVTVVELRYEDGVVERVHPVEGFILHELAPEHYRRGHRLELAVALDASGRVLERQPFRTASPGVYPCDKPVDHGHGVMMCP